MNPILFKTFFEMYSKNVDHADSQYFWKLSDEIIFTIITRHLSNIIHPEATVLDAGGGSGRWIIKLARVFPCNFILYDLSTDMLERAQNKLKDAKLLNRVGVVGGDLLHMNKIPTESVDHVISIYNPLSFTDEPQKAVLEIYRVTRKGGVIFIMAQNMYNAIAVKTNSSQTSAEELNALELEKYIKWAPHVPPLRVFSKEDLESTISKAGFDIVSCHGIPIFVQPGPEDFDPKNEKESAISKKLKENQDFFNEILRLELKYNGFPTIANRGMNLLVIAKKTH